MISGVAFCPHPPVLVPDVAVGAAPESAGIRDAAIDAIRRVADGGRRLVLLGTAEVSRAHSPLARGSLTGFGVPLEVHLGSPGCGGELELPLSLTIGAWLVREAVGPRSAAVGYSVGPDFGSSRAAADLLGVAERDDVALVVMGDGTARRGEKAPGHLDERAAGFDDAVAAALGSGDAAALEALDERLGAHLLAAGVPAWRAAGRLLVGGRYDAELLHVSDPFGVAYFVAVWTAGA